MPGAGNPPGLQPGAVNFQANYRRGIFLPGFNPNMPLERVWNTLSQAASPKGLPP